MLTKEKIIAVLESHASWTDGAVWPHMFDDLADALLKLQGAVPEGAIPEGYITEECPEGYVAKEARGCNGCAFITSNYECMNMDAYCFARERKDGKYVIFIRKEDAK